MKQRKEYTTKQAAAILGVHRVTLQEWRLAGRVKASNSLGTNGGTIHLWTEQDIRRAANFKRLHFGKGKGRKPKT